MEGMRKLALTGAALALTAGAAQAGGIEWIPPTDGVGILFEKGRQLEFSIGSVMPHISGEATSTYGGQSSGNMARDFVPYSLGIKLPIGDKVDFAFIIDTPAGASVAYPTGTGYPYAGSTAKITEHEYKALLRYKFTPNFSIYGGVRMNEAKGEAHVIAAPLLDYTLSTSTSSGTGWLAGVAYEKPEIALRVSLTYASAIDHTFNATESVAGTAYTNVPTTFHTTLPKSWTLNFQTGVNPKTLVFGSVEWRNWKRFDISPTIYTAVVGSPLVSYDSNVYTYTLGVGRKLTDNLSGAISIGYEKSNGGFAGNLGPTDGYKSLTLALIYTKDKMKITGGITYVKIGNAQTEGSTSGTALSNFNGNHAIAVGVKVGYSF